LSEAGVSAEMPSVAAAVRSSMRTSSTMILCSTAVTSVGRTLERLWSGSGGVLLGEACVTANDCAGDTATGGMPCDRVRLDSSVRKVTLPSPVKTKKSTVRRPASGLESRCSRRASRWILTSSL
jgi:hypothetical protein